MMFFGPYMISIILVQLLVNIAALYFLVAAILINWGAKELANPIVSKIMAPAKMIEAKIPLTITINQQLIKVGCFIVALALWILLKIG